MTQALGAHASSAACVHLPQHPARRRAEQPALHRQRMVMTSAFRPQGADIGVNVLSSPKLVLTAEERQTLDTRPDAEFYAASRMMQHVDEAFIGRLTDLLRSQLSHGASVLDLCSSWTSLLPPELHLERVVGHGMNAQELAANTALHMSFVQDLNADPMLPSLADRSFDAVLCTNGMQYLRQPEAVFSEALRVLRPGGCILVAFSSHRFKEKATAGWLQRNLVQRLELVQTVLEANGFESTSIHSWPPLPDLQYTANQPSSFPAPSQDAFCAVVGYKPAAGSGRADMQPDNVSEWLVAPAVTSNLGATQHDASDDPGVRADVLMQWEAAYGELVQDALQLGIPERNVPRLPRNASAQEVQATVANLQDMVASFLSSGL